MEGTMPLCRVSGGDGGEWDSAFPQDSQPVGREEGIRRFLWGLGDGCVLASAYPQWRQGE